MKKNSGMTILETSISLMILGIIIVGILNCLYMASKISVSNRNRISAVQIAQNKIEEIKNMQYAYIQNNGPSNNSLPEGKTTVVVNEKVSGTDAVGKEIKVKVEWVGGKMELNEEFTTFVRKE